MKYILFLFLIIVFCPIAHAGDKADGYIYLQNKEDGSISMSFDDDAAKIIYQQLNQHNPALVMSTINMSETDKWVITKTTLKGENVQCIEKRTKYKIAPARKHSQNRYTFSGLSKLLESDSNEDQVKNPKLPPDHFTYKCFTAFSKDGIGKLQLPN